MEAGILSRQAAPSLPLPRGAQAFLSDARLVAMIRGGHEEAFEALYDRHHRPILSFCRHLLGDAHEAEDAVQHTFLAAYRELAFTTKDINVRPWLFTIARNRCYSILRARRDAPTDEWDVCSTEGLGAEVQRREDLRELIRDMADLPEQQRAALVLAELEALSHTEIGNVLGVRPDKVKALVFQARTSLTAAREARDISCADIRQELAVSRAGGLRRGHLRRHLHDCAGCREYRAQMDRQRRGLRLILPVVPSLALKEAILGSVVLGGGSAAVAGGGALLSGALKGGGLLKGLLAVVAVTAGTAGTAVMVVTGGLPLTPVLKGGLAGSTSSHRGVRAHAGRVASASDSTTHTGDSGLVFTASVAGARGADPATAGLLSGPRVSAHVGATLMGMPAGGHLRSRPGARSLAHAGHGLTGAPLRRRTLFGSTHHPVGPAATAAAAPAPVSPPASAAPSTPAPVAPAAAPIISSPAATNSTSATSAPSVAASVGTSGHTPRGHAYGWTGHTSATTPSTTGTTTTGSATSRTGTSLQPGPGTPTTPASQSQTGTSSSGDGNGNGHAYGHGNGSGTGYGHGNGSGTTYGGGSGYGHANSGSGGGSGNGPGVGSGSGSGYATGSGQASGSVQGNSGPGSGPTSSGSGNSAGYGNRGGGPGNSGNGNGQGHGGGYGGGGNGHGGGRGD